jgi:hypothetical protein
MRHRVFDSRGARAISFTSALLFAAASLAVSPPAYAQDDTQGTPPPKKPKKPKKKPKPADDEQPADAAPPPAAEPAPAPEAAPPPPPSTAPAAEAAAPVNDEDRNTYVYEKPTQTYYFIGLRYRATLIPKFMVNLFVNDGSTFASQSFGAEIDIRRDSFSLIPWVTYASYGFGDTLFFQKNQPDAPNNYSDVSSSLSAIYVGADVLWSKDLDSAKHVQFEYGAGFGLGVLFGTLTNDWVYQTAGGPLQGENGNQYAPCPAGSQNAAANSAQFSCNPGAHSGATTAKVGGYSEPNWTNGGSVPVVFPHLALPVLGIRYEPIKQIEMRFSVGFSLTGFFGGFSIDYGIPPKKDGPPASAH